MSRYFYVHPESGSAFVDTRGPEIVCAGEPLCEHVDYEIYVHWCREWEIKPEPEIDDFKDVLG